MPTTAKATVKAHACLAKAVPIPSAPLLHMGNVALLKSDASFTVGTQISIWLKRIDAVRQTAGVLAGCVGQAVQ
jgi:hypothetical protein